MPPAGSPRARGPAGRLTQRAAAAALEIAMPESFLLPALGGLLAGASALLVTQMRRGLSALRRRTSLRYDRAAS